MQSLLNSKCECHRSVFHKHQQLLHNKALQASFFPVFKTIVERTAILTSPLFQTPESLLSVHMLESLESDQMTILNTVHKYSTNVVLWNLQNRLVSYANLFLNIGT